MNQNHGDTPLGFIQLNSYTSISHKQRKGKGDDAVGNLIRDVMRRMAAVAAAFALTIFLTTTTTTAVAESEPLNSTYSSSVSSWPAAIGDGEPHQDASTLVNDNDALDGGFSSLDGMLQWAIGHSDPEKLKETAQHVQRLSASELKDRQLKIKEVMDELKTPSDAQLMQIALDDLNNSSLSLEDQHRALQELLILVEPIDNAIDLGKLGGFGVLIRVLSHPDLDSRSISAWVLGTASQNNPVVQKQVLEMGALTKLMQMVKSESAEEGLKAFYAVSALIRNNLVGEDLFYAEAGDQMLQDILSNSKTDIRLRRKAVSLVADLAVWQLENVGKTEPAFFNNRLFLKAIVDLTLSTDLDLQEKALVAIKSVLHLKTTDASIIKDFCDLDGALERVRQQLEDLMADEINRDYAMDIESLRREVELIFHRKLRKVRAFQHDENNLASQSHEASSISNQL